MDAKPMGPIVLAIVHWVLALPWLLAGTYLLMLSTDVARIPFVGGDLAKYLFPVVLLAAGFGVAYLATGWGLWRGQSWARASAVTIGAIVLAGLTALAVGVPSVVGVVPVPVLAYGLVEAAVIYYLLAPTNAPSVIASEASRASAGMTCPWCGHSGIESAALLCPRCNQSLFPSAVPAAPAAAQPPAAVKPPAALAAPPSPPQPVPAQLEQTQAAAIAWLVLKSGPAAGRRLDLAEDNEVGRGPQCRIVLADDYVSRSHARIRLEGGQYFIYDLGSKAGTFVNDRRVQRLMLYDGSLIRLGRTTMEFKRVNVAS